MVSSILGPHRIFRSPHPLLKKISQVTPEVTGQFSIKSKPPPRPESWGWRGGEGRGGVITTKTYFFWIANKVTEVTIFISPPSSMSTDSSLSASPFIISWLSSLLRNPFRSFAVKIEKLRRGSFKMNSETDTMVVFSFSISWERWQIYKTYKKIVE